MRNKLRRVICAGAVAISLLTMTVPAFATEVDELTPEGNLTLIDDYSDPSANKQFITVQSRNGNYYYIVIDHSGTEDNVHFLNQVDESDLLAIMENNKNGISPVECSCTDKCNIGSINTNCKICGVNVSECKGTERVQPEEPEQQPSETQEKPADMQNSKLGLVPLVALLAAGGGAAFFFLKKKKDNTPSKPDNVSNEEAEDEYEFEIIDEDDVNSD